MAGNPAVMSPEFIAGAVRYQASPDPDIATAETVRWMCSHIHTAADDAMVQWTARNAVRHFRGGPIWAGLALASYDSPQIKAESCWWFAKHAVKFVHHSEQIWKWLGETDQLQLLISPDVLLRMGTPEGDCADFSMLICAMLETLGVAWEIVTIKCDPKDPTLYTHVFPRLVLDRGRRETLDASHGQYPGWQVPRSHTFGLQVWDTMGNPIPDQAVKGDGLGMYRLRGFGACGDCLDEDPDTGVCSLTDTVDCAPAAAGTSPATPDLSTVYTCPLGTSTVNGICTDSIGNVTVPPSNSASYAAAITALGKMGLTLAEIQTMPAGTVVNPNGQIIRQSPGFAVPVGSTLSTSLSSLGSSPMIWVVLGLGALLLVGGKH